MGLFRLRGADAAAPRGLDPSTRNPSIDGISETVRFRASAAGFILAPQ